MAAGIGVGGHQVQIVFHLSGILILTGNSGEVQSGQRMLIVAVAKAHVGNGGIHSIAIILGCLRLLQNKAQIVGAAPSTVLHGDGHVFKHLHLHTVDIQNHLIVGGPLQPDMELIAQLLAQFHIAILGVTAVYGKNQAVRGVGKSSIEAQVVTIGNNHSHANVLHIGRIALLSLHYRHLVHAVIELIVQILLVALKCAELTDQVDTVVVGLHHLITADKAEAIGQCIFSAAAPNCRTAQLPAGSTDIFNILGALQAGVQQRAAPGSLAHRNGQRRHLLIACDGKGYGHLHDLAPHGRGAVDPGDRSILIHGCFLAAQSDTQRSIALLRLYCKIQIAPIPQHAKASAVRQFSVCEADLVLGAIHHHGICVGSLIDRTADCSCLPCCKNRQRQRRQNTDGQGTNQDHCQ